MLNYVVAWDSSKAQQTWHDSRPSTECASNAKGRTTMARYRTTLRHVASAGPCPWAADSRPGELVAEGCPRNDFEAIRSREGTDCRLWGRRPARTGFF